MPGFLFFDFKSAPWLFARFIAAWAVVALTELLYN